MVTLHVGTYAGSGGPGLVPVTLGRAGILTVGEAFPEAANASFGVHSARHGLTYVADEQDDGSITVLRRENGTFSRVARLDSGGAAPCYLALDGDETQLAVANYESGNVAVFELDSGGLPGPRSMFQSSGSGPVTGRQEGPHAHCARFSRDGTSLYVVDLGSDRVHRIALDRSGIGDASTAWSAPAGTGPRHLLFHPDAPLAVVLSELGNELTVLAVEEGALRPIGAHSSLPADFAGESLGGHLALNAAGDRVYVSNRGHDSIAVFALDASGGEVELLQHIASGGANPRHFVLLEDERLLIAAHEKDGRVEAFEMARDGRLSAFGPGVEIPGACFVMTDPGRVSPA